MKRSLLSITLCAGLMSAYAQTSLVKDMNPGNAGSFPFRMTAFGNKLVFAANDGTNGYELWARDTSGTNLAFNINPAAASSINYSANRGMAVLGKYIYFPAANGSSGTELYRWDGTNPPMLAAEIWAGTNGSGIDEVVSMNGKIYFDANDGSFGEELWVYDTTTNTASRITDIYTLGSSSIQNITAYRGKIVFAAFNNTSGTELWSYDPATNNTVMVSDIEIGASSSSPNNFKVADTTLYFTAYTNTNGRELYGYNGTTATRLTDVVSGFSNGISNTVSGAPMIGNIGGKIYFSGNEASTSGHLYKYDPSNGLTTLVYKVNPTGNSNITNILTVKNKIYFSADNGTVGNELWMYNGTGVPVMVADIYKGAISGSPSDITQMGKNVYFRAADSANGTELFMLMDSTLSIKNVSFTGNVTVYPNPATADAQMEISLESSQYLHVTLTDMAGRIIYKNAANYQAGKNNLILPVANKASGMYIYTVRNDNGQLLTSGRLSKQ